jgi:DNA primase
MFDFVMEVEGLDFKGALELLARKAGVDLEQYPFSIRHVKMVPNKERLYQLARHQRQSFIRCNFLNIKRHLSTYSKNGIYQGNGTYLAARLCSQYRHCAVRQICLRRKAFSEAEIKQAGLSAAKL